MTSALLLALLLGTEPAAPKEPETPSIPRPGEPVVPVPYVPPAKTAEKAPEKNPTAEELAKKEKAALEALAAKLGPEEKKVDEKKPEVAKVAPPSNAPMPTPITGGALADELKKHATEQKAARANMQKERARLEELKQELETSRTALREETRRLEDAMAAARNQPSATPVAVAPVAAPIPAPVPVKPAVKQNKPQLQALGKTLKGMKPEQAAQMVARLDRQLAADILREMKPAEAGAILDKLKPELAAELVSVMAAAPAPQKDML